MLKSRGKSPKLLGTLQRKGHLIDLFSSIITEWNQPLQMSESIAKQFLQSLATVFGSEEFHDQWYWKLLSHPELQEGMQLQQRLH